jgi:hypothetical protein
MNDVLEETSALISGVNIIIPGLLDHADEDTAISREVGNSLSVDTVCYLRRRRCRQPDVRASNLTLLGYCLQQSVVVVLLFASYYSTHVVEIYTHLLAQVRSLMALDSQAGNIIHQISLIKAILKCINLHYRRITLVRL